MEREEQGVEKWQEEVDQLAMAAFPYSPPFQDFLPFSFPQTTELMEWESFGGVRGNNSPFASETPNPPLCWL